jgi:hypothetical protein
LGTDFCAKHSSTFFGPCQSGLFGKWLWCTIGPSSMPEASCD